MTVQSGSNSVGYDKSNSVAEKITATNARITALVAKGRDGTTAVQSARQQLADLQAQQTNHLAAVAATKAVLAAHAATCKGSTAAAFADDRKTE